MKIITRFPPSPTGVFHVGSARTALFNFLYARQRGGEMILRFEDTDKERSKKEFEKDIMDGLFWLGLEYDNKEIEHQSERSAVYKKHLLKLIKEGSAYEAEDNNDKTGKVVRFKNPGTEVAFKDEIRGEIKFDTAELGDFVIAKSLDEPLYHLAVVVDDFESGVTHIIRGEDHISNTARQIMLQEVIGASRPIYAHIPLILAPDKSKLSKRHGAVSISEYKNMGYLPEAMVNYLALLGWNPGDEREIFSMQELIQEFTLERVQKGGAIFNIEKLNSINSHYIKKLSTEDFVLKILGGIPERLEGLADFSKEKFNEIAPLIQERVSNGDEAQALVEAGELDYFFEEPKYEPEKLSWKETSGETTTKHLQYIIKTLDSLQDDKFVAENIKSAVWDYASKEGRGEVLWPMRYALTGAEKSPDPFEIAAILGKNETVKRLEKAKQLTIER